MPEKMKGIVPPPYEIPAERAGQRKETPKVQVPLLIRLFAWFCFLRAAIYLTFGLIVGTLPDSPTAAYLSLNFDSWPKQIPPEAVFYIQTVLYSVIGWRWVSRDWRARWGAMFVTGASAASALVHLTADYAAGAMNPLTPAEQGAVTLSIVLNLAVCGYLAFYPGMAQAFKETPWE